MGRWKPGEKVRGAGTSPWAAGLIGLGRRGVVPPCESDTLGTRLCHDAECRGPPLNTLAGDAATPTLTELDEAMGMLPDIATDAVLDEATGILPDIATDAELSWAFRRA